jgi:hypothetical protein
MSLLSPNMQEHTYRGGLQGCIESNPTSRIDMSIVITARPSALTFRTLFTESKNSKYEQLRYKTC